MGNVAGSLKPDEIKPFIEQLKMPKVSEPEQFADKYYELEGLLGTATATIIGLLSIVGSNNPYEIIDTIYSFKEISGLLGQKDIVSLDKTLGPALRFNKHYCDLSEIISVVQTNLMIRASQDAGNCIILAAIFGIYAIEGNEEVMAAVDTEYCYAMAFSLGIIWFMKPMPMSDPELIV